MFKNLKATYLFLISFIVFTIFASGVQILSDDNGNAMDYQLSLNGAELTQELTTYGALDVHLTDTNGTSSIEEAIEFVKAYYKNKGSLDSFWEMAAVRRYVDVNSFAQPNWNESDVLNSPSDYAGRIIGHVIKGENPRTVYEERDIVAELELMQNGDTGSFGMSNQHIWAMLALDIARADYDRDKALDVLLSFQNSDGSFGEWSEWGDDELGMAFLTLSGYLDNPNVTSCINKSVAYLKNRYSNGLPDNSNTLSACISGLTAVGEDVRGEAWTFSGTNLIDELLKYSCGDKGFKYMLSSEETDAFSTYGAAIALGDALDSQSVFVKLKDIDFNTQFPENQPSDLPAETEMPTSLPPSGGGSGSVSSINISISVKGYNGSNIHTNGALSLTTADTPFTALLSVLGSDVSYSGSGSNIYVYGIKGLNEFDHGAESGWLYYVNGISPDLSANSYKLKDGDNLVWQYSHTYIKEIGSTSVATYLQTPVPLKALKQTDLNALINNIAKNILKKNTLTDWELLALIDAGITPDDKHIKAFTDSIKKEYRLVTDLERTILLCQSLDIDPDKYNLTEMLLKKDFEMQGANGLIYGILVLNASGSDTSELVDRLLSYQKSSGGFCLEKGSGNENTDITAMAIFSLSAINIDKPNVKNSIDKAISWLSEKQDKNGGYLSYNKQSSETVSQVIMALSASGTDPAGSNFKKGSADLLTNLMTFMLDDYTFEHEKGGGSNAVATEQALRALCAYRRFTETPDKADTKFSEHDSEYAKGLIFEDKADISDWALPYVKNVYEKGYMIGDDMKRFLPKKELTVSELSTVLIKMMPETSVQNKAEGDRQLFAGGFIDNARWDYLYIKTAYENDWFRGLVLKDLIDRPINRGETALIISNALMLGSVAEISKQDGINNVVEKGIMVGYGNDFGGNDGLSREMLAVICEKIEEALADYFSN